jgi:hypothetical protein
MRTGWRLFAVLLSLFALAKVLATAGVTELGIDGAFYTDVAQYVRDGSGLQTGQSLYHKGYGQFPHPTSIYPAWPLLLGFLARLVDMRVLVHWLPAALWLASLVAAWRLGSALRPQSFFQRVHLNGGHLLMLLLGLNTEYFTYTSMPYTEGLSWLLLLLFGHRLLRLAPRDDLASAAEIGAWAGLLVLCRAQFLIVPIAVFAALSLRLRGGWRGLARLLVAVAVFAALLTPHMVRNAGILQDASLLTLLRFDQAQVSDALEPLPVLIETHGLGGLLLDRSQGLLLAFDPTSSRSYLGHFHAFIYGLLLLPWALFHRRHELLSLLRRALAPGSTAWWVMALFALGGLASVHLAHKSYEPAWYFHRRHALVVLPAVFAGCCALLSLPGWKRVPGLLLLLTGLAQGSWELAVAAHAGTVESWAATSKRGQLHQWLLQESAERNLVVALPSPDAQRLAWRTPGVGFHTLHETSSPAVLEALCEDFKVDVVALHPGSTRGWAFRDGPLVAPTGYEALDVSPSGFTLFVRTSP